MTVIEGGNSKNKADVDKRGNLHVRSTRQTIEEFLTEEGHAYNLNTGTINFGNATENAVSYVKNNEEEDFVITAFIVLIGNSDVTGKDMHFQVVAEPTGGTIITSATAATPQNRRAGSKNTLNVDWNKGDGTKTVIGGNVLIESIFSGFGRNAVVVATVLPKGRKIALLWTAPAGNTDQNCQFAIAGYLDKL